MSLTRIKAMLLAQLPTTTVKTIATEVWPGWAGLPEACLFVLVSIASWLSSHLLPMQSYLYQVPAAWVSFAVITHILNALQPQALYTRCPRRKSLPAGEVKLRFRGQGQLLCPSAWLISRLHLDWEPGLAKHALPGACPKRSRQLSHGESHGDSSPGDWRAPLSPLLVASKLPV